DTDLADELEIIDLNVRSTVHLAKRAVTDMAARNSGKVLITSSIASTMPGSTETEFFDRADMANDTKVGQQQKDDPAQVAAQGFDALMSGRSKITAGSMKTKAQGLANKVLPDRTKAAAHERMAKPDSSG